MVRRVMAYATVPREYYKLCTPSSFRLFAISKLTVMAYGPHSSMEHSFLASDAEPHFASCFAHPLVSALRQSVPASVSRVGHKVVGCNPWSDLVQVETKTLAIDLLPVEDPDDGIHWRPIQ